MKFNNSFELAHYFVTRNLDTRQWGIFREFEDTVIWHKYFVDMQDKYVRGKSITEKFFAKEYQDCELQCISQFIDYINSFNLAFPIQLDIDIESAYGGFTHYNTQVIENGQMTLSQFGIA